MCVCMYVCMHDACMYVCMYVCISLHKHMLNTRKNVHGALHARLYVCLWFLCTCILARTIHSSPWMPHKRTPQSCVLSVCVCVFVSSSCWTCKCTCVCSFTHTCMRTWGCICALQQPAFNQNSFNTKLIHKCMYEKLRVHLCITTACIEPKELHTYVRIHAIAYETSIRIG